MNILFIGDVVGRPGREMLRAALPQLRSRTGCSLVIANGENAAAGAGITRSIADELHDAGVDVITGGNHIWDKIEGMEAIDGDPTILRPVNYPPGSPGRGMGLFDLGPHRVGVVSLLGRIFLPPMDCPFRAVDAALESLRAETRILLIDFHAEATSEKIAMGWYVDGRASAVIGTHTHVQTADERILPQGTGYITDAGMTGPFDSVIGVRKELAIRRLTSGLPVRFRTADGDVRLQGLRLEIDPQTGRTTAIERLEIADSREETR